jgi:hypothetical protein
MLLHVEIASVNTGLFSVLYKSVGLKFIWVVSLMS